MRISSLLLCALAWVLPARARAQTCIGPGGVVSGACGIPGDFGRMVGGFGLVGAAAWPEHKGLMLTVGAFHDSPVGVEASLLAPVTLAHDTTKPLLITTGSLRLALYRDGFGTPWAERARPPALATILGLRLGGGLLWGRPDPASFHAGITAELLWDGWLLVALRPTLAFVRLPAAEAAGRSVPFAPYPTIDLAFGSLADGVYAAPEGR